MADIVPEKTLPKSFLEIASELHPDLAEFARGIVWRRLPKPNELGFIFSKMIQLIPEAERLGVEVSSWIEITVMASKYHLGDSRVINLPDDLWGQAALASANLIAAIRAASANTVSDGKGGAASPNSSTGKSRLDIARRLKWLCGEMVARLEEEKRTNEYGSYGFSNADEAAKLAMSLGFRYAPIAQKEQIFSPENPQSIPLPHIGPGVVGQMRKGFSCVVIDPTGDSLAETAVCLLITFVVNGKEFSTDLCRDMDKTNARANAILVLKRSMRVMDGIIDPMPPAEHANATTAPDPFVPSTDVTGQRSEYFKRSGAGSPQPRTSRHWTVRYVIYLFSEVPSQGRKFLAYAVWITLALLLIWAADHIFHLGIPIDPLLKKLEPWK